MSGFLLDTNIPSELVRTVPEARVKTWVAAREMGSLHLSVVSVGELHKGFEIMPDGRRKAHLKDWLAFEMMPLFAGRVLPVTQAIAERWGLFDGQRQMMGRPLSAPDGMIAATAAEHGLILVTRNVKDFEGLGVPLLNPWDLS